MRKSRRKQKAGYRGGIKAHVEERYGIVKIIDEKGIERNVYKKFLINKK